MLIWSITNIHLRPTRRMWAGRGSFNYILNFHNTVIYRDDSWRSLSLSIGNYDKADHNDWPASLSLNKKWKKSLNYVKSLSGIIGSMDIRSSASSSAQDRLVTGEWTGRDSQLIIIEFRGTRPRAITAHKNPLWCSNGH